MLSSATLLAVLASLVAAKDGRTFAVNHFYGNGPLTIGRMDPIVNPGVASGHVHAIQGGSNFALTMSDDTLLDSNCTSSLVKNDKSNYWSPALYFQDPTTKELTAVDMFYMNVYYFFEATDDEIVAFEPGHRMVIGSTALRTPPATGAGLILDLADGTPQPVQWTCPRSNTNSPLYPTDSTGVDGVGIQDPGNAGAGSGFPDQNCDGYASPLRADIHFPSCYNPAAGLDNYKENMQFPSSKGTASGKANCPEGWVHTPHLFYEVYWNTPKFVSQWTPGQGTQPFVLSNGDSTGYSLHADFISGWDTKTLQQIIDNCDAGDSGMDQCPGLIGGLNDPSDSCNINNLVPETISGSMKALPGNNLVTGWGTNVGATPGSSSTAATVPSATSSTAAIAVSVSSEGAKEVATSTQSPSTTDATQEATTPASEASSTQGSSPDTTTTTTSFHTSTTTALTTVKVVPTSATSASAGGSDEPTTTSAASAGGNEESTTTSAASPAATGDDDTCEPDSTSTTSPVDGWTYTGCYSDNLSSRVLSGIKFANVGQHQVTNTKCIDYCEAAGYIIAGTEYGGQCFCGDEITGSTKEDDSVCDMPCEGDDSQTCGGSKALTVYSSTNSTAAAAKRDALPEMVKEQRRRHLHKHLRRSHEIVAARDTDC